MIAGSGWESIVASVDRPSGAMPEAEAVAEIRRLLDLYDPADLGIPGSFGLVYTNREFLDANPTAAEDSASPAAIFIEIGVTTIFARSR